MNEHWVLLGILLYHLRTVNVFFHRFTVTNEIIFPLILSRITLLIFHLDRVIKSHGILFGKSLLWSLMVMHGSVSSNIGTLSAIDSFKYRIWL